MADELMDVVGDVVGRMIRRAARRGRAEVQRGATAGRQYLETRQKQRDLDHFWARLGKTAHHLVEAGEIDHPALRKAMDRIGTLEAELASGSLAPSDEPE